MPTPKDKRYKHLFDTQDIRKKIKQKSVNAGLANLSSQGLSLGITLLRSAILARLLSPSDYGVFTMVVVVASFATIFKDLGLSTATIREKNITHAQVSNLFWINAFIGLTSMIFVWVIAPAIVWFYQDTRLSAIAMTLATGFLFGGLTVQHQALLKRQMQFGKIAIITVTASLASSLVGVLIALQMENYWALVWMQVSHNCFLMVGFWYTTKWYPSAPSRYVGTKKILSLGIDVAGLNAFSTVTKQIDKIIIGRISDARSLGLYGKGGQIPQLIAGQFRMAFFAIALPALSALQEDKKQFATYYYKFLTAVCWTTMILSAFCFVFAEEIILLYFGPKWSGSVIYLRIFSIFSFTMPAITTLDQIPLALGHSRKYLIAGICRSITLLCGIALVTPFYGSIGIALCVALSDIISFIPFALLCLKHSPITLSKYFKTTMSPIIVSIAMTTIFYFLKPHPLFQIHGVNIVFMVLFLFIGITFFLIFDFLRIGTTTGITSAILNKIKPAKTT